MKMFNRDSPDNLQLVNFAHVYCISRVFENLSTRSYSMHVYPVKQRSPNST